MERRFCTVATAGDPLPLECGQVLTDVTLCYESVGPENGEVVLICHALTGDSHATGWWAGLVGPGKAIDTQRYRVLCANVLGGCSGSTGPASLHPATGRPYGSDFPPVTVRDMVRAQARLLDRLNIGQLLAVVGGSLGGMQALEWAATYPDRMRAVVAIGAAGRFHPQGIAWNEVQRQAILSDPDYRDGHYYGTPGPVRGLAAARMLGMVTYRSDESLWHQFGRKVQPGCDPFARGSGPGYAVQSYLHHQGRKLTQRFDANSYLYLAQAMDLMDLGRGRESYEAAHAAITAPVLSVGIRSDLLFPPYLQKETVALIRASGGRAEYFELDSPWGHDAFLVDLDQLAEQVERFLRAAEVRRVHRRGRAEGV